ncbi:MAG: Rpn family recombination-promoting nuclease/putative transposase, partial [Lachnospiraceae bacterium]|nr:Rpn family recombination-promoting nuclease/putative transposase [Lachnospiraceae bacterium]
MPQNLNNTRVKDSSSKLIFGDPILCAQFLRGYLDIPMLKDVQPEDIEDVTERFVHMFTEERNSDVIKKVHLKKGEMPFCFISLIEHKSEVDYNVVMQIFRYMAFIWEDSVRSTSSHSQQRLFRGEVLSLTP